MIIRDPLGIDSGIHPTAKLIVQLTFSLTSWTEP